MPKPKSMNKPKPKPLTRRVKGKGNYELQEAPKKQPGTVNKFARAAGETLGGMIPLIPGIGKLIPAPLVSAASSALGDAGSWIARALGFGRYTVKKNSLIQRSRSVENGPHVASPPSFGSDKKGSDIIFSHREYVGDVKSSVGFATTTYPINPGNQELFPWMSKVASLYEEYEMLGLMFEYRSTSATAVGTTSSGMGVVIMATDYDCYDENYTTKRQMEAAEFSSAAVPFETFLHPVECDRSRNVLAREFVVPGMTKFTDASGDARLSVLGNFTIATEGQQVDGTTIGELWVTYHVRLSRPILELSPPIHTVYTCAISAAGDTDLVLTSMKTRVANGLALTATSSGTGDTARLVLSNATAKLRGTYAITATTSYLINPASSDQYVPSNNNVLYTGACTVSDWRSYSMNATLSSTSFSNTSAYNYTVTTTVDFRGDVAAVDIPILGAKAGVTCLYNVLILPFRNIPFTSMTWDKLITDGYYPIGGTPAASSGSFSGVHSETPVTTVGGAAVIVEKPAITLTPSGDVNQQPTGVVNSSRRRF